MKILLTNPPWIENTDVYGIRAGSRWPHLRHKKETLPYYPFPFFLAYAAAVLKNEGYSIMLKDCIAESITKDGFMGMAEQFSPDIVVIETSTPSINNDMELAREIKIKTGSRIVLCGPHVTALPEEILNESYIDFVLLGEYEHALKELVSSIQNKKSPENVKGTCGRYAGRQFFNKNRFLMSNIDEFPYPAREELDMGKYNDPFCKHMPNTPMISSRGCPYACSFCLEPWVFYGAPNYRTRLPENVVAEMEHLVQNYKTKEIYFDDSSFSVDQSRVIDICKLITERRLDVAWSCMADAKLHLKTLYYMKKAGCCAIKFGVESASPSILRNVNKHFDLGYVRRVVRFCKKAGIQTHATYMFGLPGETRKTLKGTIDFAFKLDTDTAQFSIAIPYPGTRFYAEAKKNKWLTTEDWSRFNGDYDSVVEYPNLTREDITKALAYCRKRLIVKTLTNPRQALSYMHMIYRSAGFTGLLSHGFQKLRFLVS